MKKIISLIILISMFLIVVLAYAFDAGNSSEVMCEKGKEYFEKNDYDTADKMSRMTFL